MGTVTKIARKWPTVVSALIVAGIVAMNVMAYRHAHAMTHFGGATARTDKPERLNPAEKIRVLICGVTVPRPRTGLGPSALDPRCRALTIPCNGQINLGAWYCPRSPDAPLVILFHGYAGEKTGTLREAKALLELGLPVLLVDFRGSGDSSESYTTIGYQEAEDVAAAIAHARQHLPHSRVILYGQSMGAAAVLRAVYGFGARPDAIIVEAVFDRMLQTVRHRFEALGLPSFPGAELLVFWGGLQAGFNGFEHNPAKYAASVACPILFLHGADDVRARVEEARRVFAAVPSSKQFEVFPALGHEPSIARYPERWKEAVGRLLKEVEAKAAD
jgi:pimeloyl-ACP methyl ester carboxylesterase